MVYWWLLTTILIVWGIIISKEIISFNEHTTKNMDLLAMIVV